MHNLTTFELEIMLDEPVYCEGGIVGRLMEVETQGDQTMVVVDFSPHFDSDEQPYAFPADKLEMDESKGQLLIGDDMLMNVEEAADAASGANGNGSPKSLFVYHGQMHWPS